MEIHSRVEYWGKRNASLGGQRRRAIVRGKILVREFLYQVSTQDAVEFHQNEANPALDYSYSYSYSQQQQHQYSIPNNYHILFYFYSSMSQQYYSQSSSIGILANVADHQERQYQEYIEDNETMATGMAMRLARNQQCEGFLGEEFADECREKLKALASDNISKQRQLTAYVSAIKAVIEQATAVDTENQDPNSNTSNEFKDQMEVEYSRALQTIANESVEITQEPNYLKLCKQLGEDQNQEEDDELAIVDNGVGDSFNKLKCPLTMALMEDPVRSKVCQHSYSRNAMYQHLRTTKHTKCPVPGCINNKMTMNELEDDTETKMRVRRYKKRESASKKMNKGFLDDEEDEFE